MRDLSIEEIKTAANPVAACKEQIRRWKISYSRYCGSAAAVCIMRIISQHWKSCCTS